MIRTAFNIENATIMAKRLLNLTKRQLTNWLLLFLLMLSPQQIWGVDNPVSYVNPLMGTDSSHDLSAGNTYPSVSMPWGMNSWTPQTGKMGSGWQYTYNDHQIRGFKQTHQPSPWINDYGQFSMMATTGQPHFSEEKRASWFSHKGEQSTPYYYKVYLADWDVTAELVPTERSACLRFSYPDTDEANLVVDAFDGGSKVNVDVQNRRITGYTVKNNGGVPSNFRNYFVIQLDHDFKVSQQNSGSHQGAVLTMQTRRGRPVHVRVASSFISEEQAWLNLQEQQDNSFDTLKEKGRERWNDVLGRIEVVDTQDIDRLRTFYSCLYRALLFPRRLYEKNSKGEVLHYSPYNGKVERGYMYTDTGFWDTFRALFPLLNLAYPSENMKIQAGLVNVYKESGFLPEWSSPGHRNCMVGNNSASVVADAYLKLRDAEGRVEYDVETLWKAVTHGAHAVHPKVGSTGRKGYEYYDRLGYVPCDAGINESVARTLEYAYDDWCIWRLGEALGKPSSETAPYLKSSQNYRNVFSDADRLMRGRKKDGGWQTPFNPLKWGDAFTEGNAWHYTWSVFHDVEGLMGLMGGKDGFCQMLDSVFSIPPLFDDSYYGHVIHEIREMQVMNMGNYAHGNQPAQHMIYLYDYCGHPEKARYWVGESMDRLYSATPDGYCGDEDNGQTSAWYVFSAMGFYPVCPASDDYAAGVPGFQKIILHREDGSSLIISRNATLGDGRIVCDGKALDRPFIPFRDLRKASTLIFGF